MKLKLTRGILYVLLILVFMSIFGFSNQNGTQSSGVSKKVARTIIDTNVSTKNKDEKTKEKLVEDSQKFVRKMAHFTIYMVVGILMMSLMYTYKNISVENKLWISICVGILYAISDEIHQYFIPGRTASPIDVGIDTSGAFLGILIMFCILHNKMNIKNEK